MNSVPTDLHPIMIVSDQCFDITRNTIWGKMTEAEMSRRLSQDQTTNCFDRVAVSQNWQPCSLPSPASPHQMQCRWIGGEAMWSPSNSHVQVLAGRNSDVAIPCLTATSLHVTYLPTAENRKSPGLQKTATSQPKELLDRGRTP